MIIVNSLTFLAGLWVVLATLLSAVRSFILPHGANVLLARLVPWLVYKCFALPLRWAETYRDRDRIMALYAPISLLMMPIAWMTLVTFGFMAMFWAIGVRPLSAAFLLSGSSLLTLGFAPVNSLPQTILAFAEATLGLGLLALLIAYLPTIYGAFSRREVLVAQLDVRAGTPPSAIEMIERFHRLQRLDHLGDLWPVWENWFGELEESHTSFAALVYFRSPRPETSWITAAGTILDCAALCASVLDIPHDVNADLCIRAGYLSLRNIISFFNIPFNPDPDIGDPISVTRAEFDAACEHLIEQGIPIKPDREQAWLDWYGWRVNYDDVLVKLARIADAPPAMWTGDRRPPLGPPAIKAFQLR